MKVIPIDGHPHDDALSDYVADAMSTEEAERFEAHVFDCNGCAQRLQRAAAFQMLLHDAANEARAEAVATLRPARRRLRVSAMSGLWAAAAALVLMVCTQSGDVDVEDAGTRVAVATELDPSLPIFADGEPGPSESLLASVDPLQSIDPLQTWPDDPFIGVTWDDDTLLDAEPCGSGEDGGPLVCQRG